MQNNLEKPNTFRILWYNKKDKEMAKLEITEEQFTAYVRVQKSGVTNMFDLRNVISLTGLNKEQCLEIMSNYGKLEEKYS
tara:strand:- start:119 stop:358 length:240 start_codon:yes stop_codon:yes gene_type:complete